MELTLKTALETFKGAVVRAMGGKVMVLWRDDKGTHVVFGRTLSGTFREAMARKSQAN